MECTVLSGVTFQDRLRILGVLSGRLGHAMRRVTKAPLRAFRRWRAATPDRLLIAPQDIRTGDPTIAADIGAGYFAFGGRIVNALGRSPFALDARADASSFEAKGLETKGLETKTLDTWARQLNGFGWLRHLRAADTAQLKGQARTLVDDFLKVAARPTAGPAWDASVAARRMLAWLSQSPIILEGGDRAFYGRFMTALVTTRLHLERQIAKGLAGEPRLLAAIALAEFGLCAPGSELFQREATDRLAAEIKAQILTDGGHISRNPQLLIDLLLDMLPLRQAYAARGIPVPAAVLNAIDRMMPMLRLFRHGDGTLALFNGMGLTAPELVATILAYDDARAQPLTNAPYSGYQRLDAGPATLIVDAGTVPPQAFSTQAHAGCLSFELSSGIQRIVINCGAPEISRANAREAARSSAAHSTLIVDDTSSCRFAAHAGLQKWLADQILSGPGTVTADRLHGDGFTTLKLAHDGYDARFGLIHARELTLTHDGSSLEGRDALEPGKGRPGKLTPVKLTPSANTQSATKSGRGKPEAVPFALRFHLHPALKARLVGDATAVLLDLPGGDRWLFQADAPVTLETSVLFAASGGPRPTLQIRVAGDSAARSVIHWAFRRRPGEPQRPPKAPIPPQATPDDTRRDEVRGQETVSDQGTVSEASSLPASPQANDAAD